MIALFLREVAGRFGGEPAEGWPLNSDRLCAVLGFTMEYAGKLRLASAQVDSEEGVTLQTMIKWRGHLDQGLKDVQLKVNGLYFCSAFILPAPSVTYS